MKSDVAEQESGVYPSRTKAVTGHRTPNGARIEMQPETRVISNCINLLEQAIDLIERIDDEMYVSTAPISPRGSIAAHLRHILDFYQNFLAGLQTGRVNYNLRQRDSLVERDRSYALEAIRHIIDRLRLISLFNYRLPLPVTTEDDGLNPPLECVSSALREIDFLQSHTIHHYSLVAMLLRWHKVEPGESFGVAPSTLSYCREETTCAQ